MWCGRLLHYQLSYQPPVNMRKIVLLGFLMSICIFGNAQITRTWTGAASDSWDATGNWSGNMVPTINETAKFVAGMPHYPKLVGPRDVGNITLNTGGSIDLNGYSLNVNGDFNVTGGVIGSGTVSCGNFDINGGTISNITLTKDNANNGVVRGTTTFSGSTIIIIENVLETAGITISIGSAANAHITFDGDLTLKNEGLNTGFLIGEKNNNIITLNGNLTMRNLTSGGSFRFGDGNNTTVSMAAGKALKVDQFNTGSLYLEKFTQAGSIPNDTLYPDLLSVLNCTIGGTFNCYAFTNILEMRGTLFNKDCTLEAPQFSNLRQNTFKGKANLAKRTGVLSSNAWYGENAFYDTLTVINETDQLLEMGATNADTFYTFAAFRATGTGGIEVGSSNMSDTNTFYDNISTEGSVVSVLFGPGNTRLLGDTTQFIYGEDNINTQFTRLTVSNDSGLVLLTPVNIISTLTFDKGLIYSDSLYRLAFNQNATHVGSGENLYVDGPVRKSNLGVAVSFIFPIGKDGYYAPVTVQGASGTPTLTAEYFHINPDSAGYHTGSIADSIDHLSSAEYWMIRKTGNSAMDNAYVTLTWDDRSMGVTQPDSLVVARWNGSAWESKGASTITGDDNAGSVRSGVAVVNFSPFTLASLSAQPNNPLPIELLYFKATSIREEVLLEWATASESDNDFFTIERSQDGRIFEDYIQVSGAGNSFDKRTYSALDQDPLAGTSYYRLAQTDFDGARTFSPMVAVNMPSKPIMDNILIYPNPVRNDLAIKWSAGEPMPLISLTNAAGVNCQTPLTTTQESAYLNVNDLPRGIYFLKITAGGNIRIHKIVLE